MSNHEPARCAATLPRAAPGAPSLARGLALATAQVRGRHAVSGGARHV